MKTKNVNKMSIHLMNYFEKHESIHLDSNPEFFGEHSNILDDKGSNLYYQQM